MSLVIETCKVIKNHSKCGQDATHTIVCGDDEWLVCPEHFTKFHEGQPLFFEMSGGDALQMLTKESAHVHGFSEVEITKLRAHIEKTQNDPDYRDM